MKLYACYGTWKSVPRTDPCGGAFEALTDAGYVPEVIAEWAQVHPARGAAAS